MKVIRMLVVFCLLFLTVLTGQGVCDQTTVSWSPSTNETVLGYRVYYGNSPGENPSDYPYHTEVLGRTNTYYEFTDLKRDLTYYSRYAAFNVAGEGPLSNELVFAQAMSIGKSFSEPLSIDNWNNLVTYVFGGAQIAYEESARFTGGGAMRIYGGRFQAVKTTFYAENLQAGEQLFVTGRLLVERDDPNSTVEFPQIQMRANGIGYSTWQRALFYSTGRSQPFLLPVTVKEEHVGGIEINLICLSSDFHIFLDDINVRRKDSGPFQFLVDDPSLIYELDPYTSEIDGWDSRAYFVLGGAKVEKKDISTAYALKASGGRYQALRTILQGLTEGTKLRIKGAVRTQFGNPVKLRTNGTGKINNFGNQLLIKFPNRAFCKYKKFEFQVTVSADDLDGMDINIFTTDDPDDELFLKDFSVSVVGGATIYSPNFQSVSGWDSEVYYVLGGAKVESFQDKSYALKASGGTHQVLRKTFCNLPEGHQVLITGQYKTENATEVKFRTNGLDQTNWTQVTFPNSSLWREFSISTTISSLDTNGLDFNAMLMRQPGATLGLRDVKLYVLQNDWRPNPAFILGNTKIAPVKDEVNLHGRGFGLRLYGGRSQSAYTTIYGIPAGTRLDLQMVFKSNSANKVQLRTNPSNEYVWNQSHTMPTGELETFNLPVVANANSELHGLEIAVYNPDSDAELILDEVQLKKPAE